MTLRRRIAENFDLNSISPLYFWKLEANSFDPSDVQLSRISKPNLGYVAFRGFCMCYFIMGVIFSIVTSKHTKYHFYYLTNLTFTLQMIYSTFYFFRLIWVLIARRNITKRNVPMNSNTKQKMHLPWPEKIIYILASITFSIPYLITFVYWIFIHAELSKHFHNNKYHYATTVFVHALNSVFAVADVCLNAIPFRISSVIFPGIAGLMYAIFTGLYEACGGTYQYESTVNKNGDHATYIYSFLNWRKYPGIAVGAVIASVITGMICHIGLVCGLSRLRVLIYNLCKPARRNTITNVPEVENADNTEVSVEEQTISISTDEASKSEADRSTSIPTFSDPRNSLLEP